MENALSKADEKLNRLEEVSREDLNQLKTVKKETFSRKFSQFLNWNNPESSVAGWRFWTTKHTFEAPADLQRRHINIWRSVKVSEVTGNSLEVKDRVH